MPTTLVLSSVRCLSCGPLLLSLSAAYIAYENEVLHALFLTFSSVQGFCHLKLRQHRPAMDCFNKALDIHPGLDEIRKFSKILQHNAEKDGGEGII